MNEIKITVKPSLQNSPKSNVETESETIDDYSQYSDNKEQISSDSRSGTPTSKPVSGKSKGNVEKYTEVIKSTQLQNEENDNADDVMVEISKKTTIKKIISRTTAVNGITQASEIEESLIKDSQINDYPKLVNSARLQERRKSTGVNFSNNTTGRKNSISSSSSESINKQEASHYLHNGPSQNKGSIADTNMSDRSTQRRNSMPTSVPSAKSSNGHHKKSSDKNKYNKKNIGTFTVNEDEEREPRQTTREQIPITKSKNTALVRGNDNNIYPKSNTGEYMIDEDKERKERSNKYERTPYAESPSKPQNRGNDGNIYHKQSTGEYIIDEPKIRKIKNEKTALTEFPNNTANREQKSGKTEGPLVKKSQNGDQSKRNATSNYQKTNKNRAESGDKDNTDRKHISDRIPIRRSQNSFPSHENENNAYHRTRTGDSERNRIREKERNRNTFEKPLSYDSHDAYKNGQKEVYHPLDNPQNSKIHHRANKGKHAKYEENLRHNNNDGYIRNRGEKDGVHQKSREMKNHKYYNDEYSDIDLMLKDESNKREKRNKSGHDKSMKDKQKYPESGGRNTKAILNGSDESQANRTPIRWVDPSKSDHLKYDYKNNRIQNSIKHNRLPLSRSDPNSKMNGSVDGSMTPSGSVVNSSEPNMENHFHKDIKEYIMRGNIKEDLYQKRHSRHSQHLHDDSSHNRERQPEMQSIYSHNYIPGTNRIALTKLREHKHDDLSNQISKILKKFDLMEKQIKFKSNSFEALPRNTDDIPLSCGFRSSCCHHSHLHCCFHCCHFCNLTHEQLEKGGYRPLRSQSHSLIKSRNYSKSYEHFSDIFRDETPLSFGNPNSEDAAHVSSPLNGARYSHKHLHQKHITYLENKLNSLEKKLQQRSTNKYKVDLESQCQSIERQLKSLYNTIPA